MQVFHPLVNYVDSIRCLDRQRLGKQRVECKQIIDILLGNTSSKAWRKHPAVLMYSQHVNYLINYYNQTLEEFARRGYRNILLKPLPVGEIVLPPFIGNEKFHSSHRSALLSKNSVWYKQFNWPEPVTLYYNYYWPTMENK